MGIHLHGPALLIVLKFFAVILSTHRPLSDVYGGVLGLIFVALTVF